MLYFKWVLPILMTQEIKQPHKISSLKTLLFLLVFGSLLYLILLFKSSIILRPPGDNQTAFFIINFSVAIPEIIIWWIAFFSSWRLKTYSTLIKQSKDGQAMAYLADGLILLSLYIVLLCVSNSFIALFKKSDNLHTAILLENYLPLAVALMSAIVLLKAALIFNSLVSKKIEKKSLILIYCLFAVFSLLLALHLLQINPDRLYDDHIPRFILGRNALLITYLIPQIILWSMDLFASLSIANYSRNIKGSLYKNKIKNLYIGILIILICIFFAQVLMLTNLSFSKFSLALIAVYGLLLLGGYGFTYIYKVAASLDKIEKI